MKKTWKFPALAPAAAAVMASAPSVSAAAKQLGIDRGTLHRWSKAGKIPPLTRLPRRQPPGAILPSPSRDPAESWAEAVCRVYSLTATEAEFVTLAGTALGMAKDATVKPAERLLAMARFQSLVKQLALEHE